MPKQAVFMRLPQRTVTLH